MGDFERTFGAGANTVSIINGFSNARRIQGFDTEEITFHFFSEASEFAKENPGSLVTRSSEGEGFKVTPSKIGEYFRFTDDTATKYPSSHATAVAFMISVPMRIDVETGYIWGLDEIREDGVTRESIEKRILSTFSEMTSQVITRQPPRIEIIESRLKEKGLSLMPISDHICLIVDDCDVSLGGYPHIEAALISEHGSTSLVYGRSNLYDLIV